MDAYKCRCNGSLVAMRHMKLGTRYARFRLGNELFKGQFVVFTGSISLDKCTAVPSEYFGGNLVSPLKHHACGQLIGFHLVPINELQGAGAEVQAAGVEQQANGIFAPGTFALYKDKIHSVSNYPLSGSSSSSSDGSVGDEPGQEGGDEPG